MRRALATAALALAASMPPLGQQERLQVSANVAGEKQLKFTRASLSSLTGDNHADASAIIRYVFGVDSSTKLTGGQALALINEVRLLRAFVSATGARIFRAPQCTNG